MNERIRRWLRRQIRQVVEAELRTREFFPTRGDTLPYVTIRFDDISIAAPLSPYEFHQTLDMRDWHITRAKPSDIVDPAVQNWLRS